MSIITNERNRTMEDNAAVPIPMRQIASFVASEKGTICLHAKNGRFMKKRESGKSLKAV